MKYLPLAFFIMFLAKTCQEVTKDPCENASLVSLKNLSSLDGCQWLFELANGTRLEPVNLDYFVTDPRDGQQFEITYKSSDGSMSICMAGEMIEILCLTSVNDK